MVIPYALPTTAGSNGSISPATLTTVNCGSSQTFTISPNSCYHIDSVIVDGTNQGTITSYTFTNVTANHTIRTVYKINTNTITPTTATAGTITPSSFATG